MSVNAYSIVNVEISKFDSKQKKIVIYAKKKH